MRLYYLTPDGEQKSIELRERPITIGRSEDADILIADEKASRVHCGIRYLDGVYYVRDLKSKNGTFVNEEKVDSQQLEPGDRLRIGEFEFVFDDDVPSIGANTALIEMQNAFDAGKGFSTILREIVDQAGAGPRRPPTRDASAEPTLPADDPRDTHTKDD